MMAFSFPSLVFRRFIIFSVNPEIEAYKNNILLKNAVMPDGESKDIKIPLDPDGNFIINWPRKEFEESFTQLSYYYLVLHDRQEKLLVQNLQIMQDAGYLNYYQGDTPLMNLFNYAQSLKNDMLEGGDLDQIADYIEIRNLFFAEVEGFLKGDAQANLTGRIDSLLGNPDVSDAQKAQYRTIRDSVTSSFTETSKLMF